MLDDVLLFNVQLEYIIRPKPNHQVFEKTRCFNLDYYFSKRDEMEKAIESGEFLEYAEYSKNLYGTRYVLMFV